MCRHLAYLGPPLTLDELLLTPRHSLLEQTWAPRDMRGGGTVNVDGFGVGWYPDQSAEPVRYRAATPMWTDGSFTGLAERTRSGAVLAAVRSATAGMSLSSQACAPLVGNQWLFSHNGRISGWPESLARLAGGLDVVDLMTLEAPIDSAVIWALLRQRMKATEPATAAIEVLLAIVAAAPESRVNLLLTDGTVVIATTWTHSLSVWRADDAVIVSSEPFGKESGWTEVPDRHLVVADTTDVCIEPIGVKGKIEGML